MAERCPRLDLVFRRAARKALIEWMRDDCLEDLVNDLWEWYLESPETQRKMADLTEGEAILTVRRRAFQLLSRQALEGNTAAGKDVYSAEAVKDALKGRSTNLYLRDILPLAMGALDEREAGYAEAIRSRYEDGLTPEQGPAQVHLSRALRALTAEVNIIAITAGVDIDGSAKDGPGSRAAVFPDTRKPHDSHSDPTGDVAVAMVMDPALRAYFYIEEELGVSHHYGTGRVVDDLSIFDGEFNGMPGVEMYRSWVVPELFPNHPQPRLANWPAEDLEMYCGGEYVPRAVR